MKLTVPDQYEIESDTKDMTAEEANEWLGSPIPLPTKQPLGAVISYHYYKSGEEESVRCTFLRQQARGLLFGF